jgi:hypothetical protein
MLAIFLPPLALAVASAPSTSEVSLVLAQSRKLGWAGNEAILCRNRKGETVIAGLGVRFSNSKYFLPGKNGVPEELFPTAHSQSEGYSELTTNDGREVVLSVSGQRGMRGLFHASGILKVGTHVQNVTCWGRS